MPEFITIYFSEEEGSFARSYPLSRQLARGLEIQPNDGRRIKTDLALWVRTEIPWKAPLRFWVRRSTAGRPRRRAYSC